MPRLYVYLLARRYAESHEDARKEPFKHDLLVKNMPDGGYDPDEYEELASAIDWAWDRLEEESKGKGREGKP